MEERELQAARVLGVDVVAETVTRAVKQAAAESPPLVPSRGALNAIAVDVIETKRGQIEEFFGTGRQYYLATAILFGAARAAADTCFQMIQVYREDAAKEEPPNEPPPTPGAGQG